MASLMNQILAPFLNPILSPDEDSDAVSYDYNNLQKKRIQEKKTTSERARSPTPSVRIAIEALAKFFVQLLCIIIPWCCALNVHTICQGRCRPCGSIVVVVLDPDVGNVFR